MADDDKKIFLDEDSQSKRLTVYLEDKKGFQVFTASTEGVDGKPDDEVLAKAHELGAPIITKNAVDFVKLASADLPHSCILIATHDMKEEDIGDASEYWYQYIRESQGNEKGSATIYFLKNYTVI